VLVAIISLPYQLALPINYVVSIRIASGLLVFVGVAILLAAVAAWLQAYPLGIGHFVPVDA